MTLNLETLTTKVFDTLYQLDKGWIGSEHYQGIAFFWNYDYRHYLRGQTPHILKKVHNRFLKEGLPLNGSSDRHLAIIRQITKLY